MRETRSSNGPTCPGCAAIYTPDEAFWFDEDLDRRIECGCGVTFIAGYHRRDTWTGKVVEKEGRIGDKALK